MSSEHHNTVDSLYTVHLLIKTPKLETSLGVCFILFPAMLLKMSTINGLSFSNCLNADFEENLEMFEDRNTESLEHNFCTSWLMFFFNTLHSSFFAPFICSRWFNAVLYCLITIARQTSLSCPCNSLSFTTFETNVYLKNNIFKIIIKMSDTKITMYTHVPVYLTWDKICYEWVVYMSMM